MLLWLMWTLGVCLLFAGHLGIVAFIELSMNRESTWSLTDKWYPYPTEDKFLLMDLLWKYKVLEKIEIVEKLRLNSVDDVVRCSENFDWLFREGYVVIHSCEKKGGRYIRRYKMAMTKERFWIQVFQCWQGGGNILDFDLSSQDLHATYKRYRDFS